MLDGVDSDNLNSLFSKFNEFSVSFKKSPCSEDKEWVQDSGGKGKSKGETGSLFKLLTGGSLIPDIAFLWVGTIALLIIFWTLS